MFRALGTSSTPADRFLLPLPLVRSPHWRQIATLRVCEAVLNVCVFVIVVCQQNQAPERIIDIQAACDTWGSCSMNCGGDMPNTHPKEDNWHGV